MSQPLTGITVVAVEQAVAAPLCTSRLVDGGARVIKIEREGGDFARRYDCVAEGDASYFAWLNHGKESVVLDFKEPGDSALLHRMIDGADVFMEQITDIGAEIEHEYEAIQPQIIAAALTRMITRAAAAEGVRIACEKNSPGLARFCALAFEAALLIADQPDTRSWTMLPEKIYVSRLRVAPGQHEVQVALGGAPGSWNTMNVDVPKDGFAVVVVNPLR
ncbi:MAG: CoA transferase [Myxococcales bacterium]